MNEPKFVRYEAQAPTGGPLFSTTVATQAQMYVDHGWQIRTLFAVDGIADVRPAASSDPPRIDYAKVYESADKYKVDFNVLAGAVRMALNIGNHTYELKHLGLPGWQCFHCGETFITQEKAREHFAASSDLPAECLDAMSPARKLARRARVAEDLERKLRVERDSLEEQLDGVTFAYNEVKRRYKLDPSGALMAFDYIEGRALTAEATLAVIEKRFPGIVARARRHVETNAAL